MSRKLFASAVMAAMLMGTGASAVLAAPPPTWDNLVFVKTKRLDAVYILPGADFRDIVGDWAKIAARGLAQLQALASPAAARAPG